MFSCVASFLSLHQQVHQSTPLPGVRFLSVLPPLPNQPARSSITHSSLHPLPPPPPVSIHPWRTEDKIGEERDSSGEDREEERKKKKEAGIVRGATERREERSKKREDCGRETVWPCVRLMYLWRKRIVDPLARTHAHTHKDTHTHTQAQARSCRDHHFVTVLAYPLSWLSSSSLSPSLALSLPQYVRSVLDRREAEHSWQQ